MLLDAHCLSSTAERNVEAEQMESIVGIRYLDKVTWQYKRFRIINHWI